MTDPIPSDFICSPLSALRKAKDENYKKGAEDMLEQVIKWLNAAIFEQSTPFSIESLPKELKKAMRPQQQND